MTHVSRYLDAVAVQYSTGRATEHTYRGALQAFIEAIGEDVLATNEPARIACGAPDYIITRKGLTIGYVEAKDIGQDLDQAERTEQLERYLKSLPNLILTDYLTFRLYSSGRLAMEARLAHVSSAGRISPDKGGANSVEDVFAAFFSAAYPIMATPNELAANMAATARLLRAVIRRALDTESRSSTLHSQLDAFRQVLLHDLEPDQFADMYAQTICYGLFAARCNHRVERGPFARESAAYDLPETNPFLRQMFTHIAGPNLDTRLSWAVDHLAQLLDRTDIALILKDFGRRTRQEDPVVHFYEAFLAAYDQALREARGVYYTPEPVVSYIVRSVDGILKRDFRISDGLASTAKVPVYESHQAKNASSPRRKKTAEMHRVLILDPATGTGTFLHGVVDHIYDAVCHKHGKGTWNSYVSEHLLPRVFGFELLMAPYAVAHMKLGIQLAETGYTFQSGERLGVYLTNTLEEAFALGDLPLFAHIIAEEANAAGRVKANYPVMVVLGNPPYSGHSANKGQWISHLLRGSDTSATPPADAKTASYFEVDGQPLAERNPKWLNDDYVKFIRFAQWRIEKTGHGVLAFISNHGYLDNPTFRGMRQSLMNTFDDIYILDLHGNAKKKEMAPDGSKDENVFDIQQGVAIGIFVKRQADGKKSPAAVYHADLWGVREIWEHDPDGTRRLVGGKYHALNQLDTDATQWTKLAPKSPLYLFVPRDTQRLEEYEAGWSVADIMPVNSVGVVTARDKLTVHFTERELRETLRDFTGLPVEEARRRFRLGDDVRDWRVEWAQDDLRATGLDQRLMKVILYRPFDRRWTYFTGRTRGFLCMPRAQVMRHMMMGENLALSTTRSVEIGRGWEHVFCSKDIIQHHTVSLKEVNYLFPLYLYTKNGDEVDDIEELAEVEENAANGTKRKPNLAADFVAEISRCLKLSFVSDGKGDLKKTLGPEDVFHYVYAVLHSPTYRARYAEFLKSDFPRIPLTSARRLFADLAALGSALAKAHLLGQTRDIGIAYPEPGDNRVEKVDYKEHLQRVQINQNQYFQGVPPEIWAFHVGGYQVCQRWLTDRNGRVLSYDDIAHYIAILGAASETISISTRIDQMIEKHGGWPLK